MTSTSTRHDTMTPPRLESRVLREGYGPGAWHGPDRKAALADVTPAVAFWRSGEGRHNIAETALHHACCARSVRAQLSGRPVEPFVLAGEDWFELNGEDTLSWTDVVDAVATEHRRLAELMAEVESGAEVSTCSEEERFGLVLGIACHAIYHAGQVQLIKRLRGA